jgi:hypothetical protein
VGFRFDFKRILIEKGKSLHFLGDWVLACLGKGTLSLEKQTKFSPNILRISGSIDLFKIMNVIPLGSDDVYVTTKII